MRRDAPRDHSRGLALPAAPEQALSINSVIAAESRPVLALVRYVTIAALRYVMKSHGRQRALKNYRVSS